MQEDTVGLEKSREKKYLCSSSLKWKHHVLLCWLLLIFFLHQRGFCSLLLTKPGSQILRIYRAQGGEKGQVGQDLSDSCLPWEALTPVETGLTGVAVSPVSNQASRTLLPPAWTRVRAGLEHPVCACLDTAPAPREGSMFVLSQGACRAIGVGTNPLFLVFLPALYLQGARLHPSLLLLGQGRLQVCSTRVCSVPPPRALGMLCPCPASAWVGLLWLLWPYSSWAFSHQRNFHIQRGVGFPNQSWAGERLLFTIAAVKKAAENRRLLAGERWEQGGASCRVSGCVPRLVAALENRAVVAAVVTHAWHQLLGGQRGKGQGAARETIIFVLEGGGRVEKTMRDGMKISEEGKVPGPNLPQLPMSSTAGLAEPPFPNTAEHVGCSPRSRAANPPRILTTQAKRNIILIF